MKRILTLCAALALLSGSAATGLAQQSSAPGQKMQQKGSVPGEPGASGYAPGHEMQQKGSKSGQPGASGYAPGHQGTVGQGNRDDDHTGRDRDDPNRNRK